MEYAEVIFALCLLLPVLYVYSRRRYPQLPSAPLFDYLPGGRMLPMFLDNRKLLRTLVDTHHRLGEVFYIWLGAVRTIVSANPADAVQILSATETFAYPDGARAMFDSVVPRSLSTISNNKHMEARKHFKDSFNHSMLESFHERMTLAIEELCDVLYEAAEKDKQNSTARERLDISELLSITTFRVITNVAFGCELSQEERRAFGRSGNVLVDEMVKDFVGYPLRHAFSIFGTRNRLFQAVSEVGAFCEQFIKERACESEAKKETRRADMLDAIMEVDSHDRVTVLSNTIAFALAGSHTMQGTVAWSIFETCCAPDVLIKIHDELSSVYSDRTASEPLRYEDVQKLAYTRMVWNETLRLHSPGGSFPRKATKDVRLTGSGVEVPAGAQIIALVSGAQRSPELWRDPQKFNPLRWDQKKGEGRAPRGADLAFSIGPRSCPGRFLADHEGVLILAELHRRFKFTLAVDPSEVVSCTGWIETARTSWNGGDLNFGVPVYVEMRT